MIGLKLSLHYAALKRKKRKKITKKSQICPNGLGNNSTRFSKKHHPSMLKMGRRWRTSCTQE